MLPISQEAQAFVQFCWAEKKVLLEIKYKLNKLNGTICNQFLVGKSQCVTF